MRAPGEHAASDRRVARPVLDAAVALALATVLLALLFVAVVLVAAAEGSVVEEVTRAANVASAVGEALSGDVFSEEAVSDPSARVCWFSRACR